jgi:PKD repeat protein
VRFADFDALLFGPQQGTTLRLERTGPANIAATNPGLTTVDLRVVRTGTNYSFEYRADESQPWNVVHSYSTATTPTHAGFVAKTWNANVGLVVDVDRLGLNELPPQAIANANSLSGPAPHTVDFSSTSFDPDGPFLAHSWDFGDGGSSTEQNPSHQFLAPGPYEVVLTVADGSGYTATDTLSVFAEGNQPPTAQIDSPVDALEFINDGISPLALEGLGTDPDDLPDSLVFDWSIDLHDGASFTAGYFTPSPGSSSSFVPDVVDSGQGVTWDVILTVTDPGGLSAADTVTIIDATLPPLALLDLRATLADGLAPPNVPGAASPWVNLGSVGSAADATLQNFGGATGWAGDGAAGEPWRLEFDGIDDVVSVGAATLPGLDQGASLEMWVQFPADTQSRSYLAEWLEDTAAPFPGMSLAVEAGQLRIFLGSWVDLSPAAPSWGRARRRISAPN